MNSIHISFGYPEITMVSAAALYIAGMNVLGHVFFGTSLVIAFCRAAMAIHRFSEAQKLLDNQQQDVKDAIYKAAAAFAGNKTNIPH
tara:strand:+ start:14827 stop:15087 length:261 start_codon:yes stop_codon:yes gene_type:complete